MLIFLARSLQFNKAMKDIALITENDIFAETLKKSLSEDKGFNVTKVNKADELLKEKDSFDMLVFDINVLDKDVKESVLNAAKETDCPLLLFCEKINGGFEATFAQKNIFVALKNDIKAQNYSFYIDNYLNISGEMNAYKNEVARLKSTLEERKLIEKAKGILMYKEKLTEDEAYKRMRKASMDSRKAMSDIAETLIETLK